MENNTSDVRPSRYSGNEEVLEKILMASVVEQRQKRRWGIFFRLILVLYLGIALWQLADPMANTAWWGHEKAHTAIVDVAGMIAAGQPASADNIIEGLRAAVDDTNTRGVILRMNTPGGSPVQSAYVHDEIRRLKARKPSLPIYAVVSDMCTSGGYYIAAAADKIYVNSASVVGSIGVIMGNFGFVEAINKLGIERRVMTAGAHKAILDPFSPVDKVAQDYMQGVLNEVHQQFITAVRQGRGARLKDTPELFTGLVWTGARGLELGLVDELGDVRQVAEEVIGAKTLVNFTPQENLMDRIGQRLGTVVASSLGASLHAMQ
ncbi:signal peptide peptidase SppA [Candidatus Woesearchaeota archaeon]|nr:signal peptide peptidase SppA [Candidatus Woesearchaeota archaeon]